MQFEAVCHITKLQMMYTLDLSLSLFTKREESEHLLLSSCSRCSLFHKHATTGFRYDDTYSYFTKTGNTSCCIAFKVILFVCADGGSNAIIGSNL